MVKILLRCLVLVALCLTCFGCSDTKQPATSRVQEPCAYEVYDDLGRRLTFSEKPKRIVSLTYGTDEILTDMVGLERMVAYSRWAGDPEISFITKEQARRVGRKVNVVTEEVFPLRPDLVVGSVAISSDAISAMEALGLKVYISCSPKNYEQMCAKIKGIAAAVGEGERGEAMVQQMDERMAKLEEKLSVIPDDKRKTVVAFNFISAMGRKGDLIDNMLNLAHVINGVALIPNEFATSYISKEQVVRVNPDIFLLPTWNYDNRQDLEGYAQRVQHDPAYKTVKAIQNNQLKFVSDKYRYVASQHIVDAVENIARTVYPEVFRGEVK